MSEHYSAIIEHYEQQAPGVLDHVCPTCGAGVDEDCVRRGGGSHAARVDRMIRQRHRHRRVGITHADAWADAIVSGSSVRKPYGSALAVLGYAVPDGPGWRAVAPDAPLPPPSTRGVPRDLRRPATRPALGSGADTSPPIPIHAGMSMRAIAAALRVSDYTVRQDIAGARNHAPDSTIISGEPGVQNWTPDEIPISGGPVSTRAIGAALGVNAETVRRDLSGAANAAPDEPMISGGPVSTRAIGAALRVSVGTVHKDLAGVQNRTPDEPMISGGPDGTPDDLSPTPEPTPIRH